MLWKPATVGEELFLCLYTGLGHPIELKGALGADLSFLVSESGFVDAVRLVATLEIFTRCIRRARLFFVTESHNRASTLGAILRKEFELPLNFSEDRKFCELAKLAGQIAEEKIRNKNIERAAMGRGRLFCYLCGQELATKGHFGKKLTIEHVWPISLGGETSEGNLLPACEACNSHRGHTISWATGPLHSTYLSSDEKPSRDLKLSLALARLVRKARSGHGPLLTLKQAALKLHPLVEQLKVPPGSRHLYFEIFQQAQAQS
jgi:hypothetical protein